MPTLYNNPVVLTAQAHGDLKRATVRTFEFARTLNCVPVTLEEITKLVPHYPVVFLNGKVPTLVAALGVRNDENLFIDDKGNWAPGCYIPAYVRRYPFVLAKISDDKVVLAAELDPKQFDADGTALFEGNRPSKLSRDVFHFCSEFQKGLEETLAFCEEVRDAGLLQAKVCTIKLKIGDPLRLTGFTAVDEKILDELDNRTVNGWRKKHCLKYLYHHIASLERMGDLAVRAGKQPAEV
jgi:hypothetical protein